LHSRVDFDFVFFCPSFAKKRQSQSDLLTNLAAQTAAVVTFSVAGKAADMCYLCEVWQFWISLFPQNDVFGSRTNTAIFALVLLFALAGWIIGCIFCRDPGVR
jgi:hypothetical protein